MKNNLKGFIKKNGILMVGSGVTVLLGGIAYMQKRELRSAKAEIRDLKWANICLESEKSGLEFRLKLEDEFKL